MSRNDLGYDDLDTPLTYAERQEVIWEAAKRPDLPPLALRVLIAINRYYNKEKGLAWPTQQTIASDLRVTREAVNKAAKALKELNFIWYTREEGEFRRWPSNRYYLVRSWSDGGSSPRSAP